MDLDDLDTPNCPACLVRMEPTGERLGIAWRCPECGLSLV
ncbi:zf-TFIIB domain-containing protein [Salinibacterium sp. G-O1]